MIIVLNPQWRALDQLRERTRERSVPGADIRPVAAPWTGRAEERQSLIVRHDCRLTGNLR
jgi:hypothetical protein